MSTNLKKEVYEQCRQVVSDKLSMYNETLNELVESSADEGASSADPSDAGVAMLQIEQANIRAQINEVLSMKYALEAIDPDHTTDHIAKGCLVKAGRNYYYLGIALGKLNVEGKVIFAISSQSPVGSKLLGRGKGDRIEVNGKAILIEEIE